MELGEASEHNDKKRTNLNKMNERERAKRKVEVIRKDQQKMGGIRYEEMQYKIYVASYVSTYCLM